MARRGGAARVVESRYSNSRGRETKRESLAVCRSKARGGRGPCFYCINCDSPRPVAGGGAPPPPPPLTPTAAACACADMLGIAA